MTTPADSLAATVAALRKVNAAVKAAAADLAAERERQAALLLPTIPADVVSRSNEPGA